MSKVKLILALSVLFFLKTTNPQKLVTHCAYGSTVKELLKLAGISGGNLLSYEAKLKKHNIDETVLGNLNLHQLQKLGIAAMGDRVKIQKFFATDADDCNSSPCKNGGICQDGFRCFSCHCDPERGYYGQSCKQKCPCRNGGRCKTTSTGFACECVPGYSGNLCGTKYLNEERILNLEKKLEEVTAKLAKAEKGLNDQQSLVQHALARPGKWKLHRANEILNQLEKLDLNSKPTFSQKLPLILPNQTQAILISVFCYFYNKGGHAYLDYEAHQKSNEKPDAKVYGNNIHYNVYANSFYYEQMIPWDNSLPNEIVFKVTYARMDGGSSNWYRIRLVGYITTE